ncbi:MAG: hypothetical protein ACREBC_19520 [Pyrinomonadaceae bacterium]
MQSRITLFIIATISAILGGAVALGFVNAEAQPAGAKQFQFVLTGKTNIGGTGTEVTRYEDAEYGIVCYGAGMGFSCAKK